VTRKLSVQLMAGITLTLVLMLGANLYMVWHQQQRDLITEMHGKARIITDQLIATRLFMARNQDRINRDSAGHMEFKGLNPAAVGRGVGNIFGEITEVRLKQTRAQVRRPENQPDAFESEALAMFTENPNLKEYFRQVQEKGRPVFRYAIPLAMEAECLRCHGSPAGETDIAGYPKEGYKLGDLGGAISVALPMDRAMAELQRRTATQVWVIVLVSMVSLLVIWWLSRRLVTKPLAHLTALTTRIGEGDLTVPPADLAVFSRSDELSLVGAHMDAMARSLREVQESLEEKVAERTRELQAAHQVQSQFLTTVSHELRTPLTSIIAFTELLRKQAAGKQLEYLDDMLESSRRLLATVNNLLDLNRLKAGRVQLFTDLIELAPLLRGVEHSLRPLAEQKHIRLHTSVADDLPLVLIDHHRVSQVMLNLVGNAIKFTPDGGTVAISAVTGCGWVIVSVQDSGPGIKPEYRETVFEAFRRVEMPGAQHQGSGLGLAVARELVELHGGSIWVQDAPGGGSLFSFTLPKARPLSEEEDVNHGSA